MVLSNSPTFNSISFKHPLDDQMETSPKEMARHFKELKAGKEVENVTAGENVSQVKVVDATTETTHTKQFKCKIARKEASQAKVIPIDSINLKSDDEVMEVEMVVEENWNSTEKDVVVREGKSFWMPPFPTRHITEVTIS